MDAFPDKQPEPYLYLIRRLASHYCGPVAAWEDLEQEGRIGVWEACQTYRADQNAALNTWVFHKVRSRILHYLRAQHNWFSLCDMPMLEDTDKGSDLLAVDVFASVTERLWLDLLLRRLAPRQAQVMRLVYAEQYEWAEAGAFLGVSEEGARALGKRAKAQLRRYLDRTENI